MLLHVVLLDHVDISHHHVHVVSKDLADCAAAVHEEDHQDEDGKVDDDVELGPDTVEEEEELEGQDDLDDDELQSMLQDDDDAPGAITDTANTDWYLQLYTAASRSTAKLSCAIYNMQY